MKNIHIVPTEKSSRLMIDTIENKLYLQPILHEKTINVLPQNIYITSDEEIKDGDWMIRANEQPTLVTPNFFWDFGVRYYKITLTTDQDLIKDGVQSIDDEFLEWFVKNPSCDSVDVVNDEYVDLEKDEYIDLYKIIIPKEEPKQHLIDMMKDDEELGLYEEPKQETTLEEAAEIYASHSLKEERQKDLNMGFIEGTKWQAERMYSEEDMRKAFIAGGNSQIEEDDAYGSVYTEYMEDWFEQFKKK